MKKDNTSTESRTEVVIGIDLGDKRSHTCVLPSEFRTYRVSINYPLLGAQIILAFPGKETSD
ncbi:MAG: hypothetical protein GY930_03370 [bacterium]|nr:hypothetical protein [bacterium]